MRIVNVSTTYLLGYDISTNNTYSFYVTIAQVPITISITITIKS